MNRKDAIAWVLSTCIIVLRRSQAKTLSQLVAAAMACPRASLASIGRAVAGTAKHQIKKVHRFCANSRVETADAMRGVMNHVLTRRTFRQLGGTLVVSLDWTDVRGLQTIMASIAFKGRSAPLCWASCHKHTYDGHRSRNAFEESLLLVLRSMIPTHVKLILLADRGFGRTELARFCQRHHMDYIIRIQPNVHVRGVGYAGKLIDYPVRKGCCKLLKDVSYRSHHQVTQHIVVRWVRGLPKNRDECWFLMSSLDRTPARISRLYGQRMGIEQLFRDAKNKRNGWSLRDTGLTDPARLDRMLLILALAYWLLSGLGLLALATRKVREWSSRSTNDCSAFTIGRLMLDKMAATIPKIIQTLIAAAYDMGRNWG